MRPWVAFSNLGRRTQIRFGALWKQGARFKTFLTRLEVRIVRSGPCVSMRNGAHYRTPKGPSHLALQVETTKHHKLTDCHRVESDPNLSLGD
jgi:hypothetical protein